MFLICTVIKMKHSMTKYAGNYELIILTFLVISKVVIYTSNRSRREMSVRGAWGTILAAGLPREGGFRLQRGSAVMSKMVHF